MVNSAERPSTAYHRPALVGGPGVLPPVSAKCDNHLPEANEFLVGFTVFKTEGARVSGVGVRFPLVSAEAATSRLEARVEARQLMDFSHGAGCGCKLSADELRTVLGSMSTPPPSAPEVIVGIATSDDAGVYRLSPDLALVQTLDFFTPIVNDPYVWGRIAATNALSDVYAMGGKPITALNIVAWPRDQIDWAVLGLVLDGGASVLAEAGCALVGGHSIDDAEPKYGMAVTGVVHPERLLTNAAGRPDDVLVLTKPLGTGVVTTAMKFDRCPSALSSVATASMTTRNDAAAELAIAAGVRCATDVTGFGLIGHLMEIANASGVDVEVTAASLPIFEGVLGLVDDGLVPGGSKRNLDAASSVDWGATPAVLRYVACDAQTSGGLLLAVPPGSVGDALESAQRDSVPAVVIGRLCSRSDSVPRIRVR